MSAAFCADGQQCRWLFEILSLDKHLQVACFLFLCHASVNMSATYLEQ